MTLRVDILNHASALVRVGDCAVLSDPWLEGTAFSGGWGLRYDNTFDDLEAFTADDRRFSILRIGDSAELDAPGSALRVERRVPALELAEEARHDYGESLPWDELCEVAEGRAEQLRRKFNALSRLVGPLRMEVSDLGRTLEVDLGRGARDAGDGSPHIVAHSRALGDWLGRRFGDDTFFAGAHFDILDPDTTAIERWALITLLEASHLDPRSLLSYLGSKDGLWFLWCRREEIVSSVAGARIKAAQVRL